MARLHGRKGVVYLQGAGSAASILSTAADWEIQVETAEVTADAMGDTWEYILRGLHKWTGTLSGPYDDASNLAWEAATFDGVSPTDARALYVYPNSGNPTQYYYGLCWPKLTVKGGVAAAVTFQAAFAGVGVLAKNP